jgi:CRP/FNR family transcriptional regulator, nitrogen fixation regulation protein
MSNVEAQSPVYGIRVPAARSRQLVELLPDLELPGFVTSFERDEEIYGEREPADFVYKVVAGAVRTFRLLDDGRRQISAFYFPGDIFGLELGDEHAGSAEAVTECELALVRRSAVASRIEEDCAAARELWTVTSSELERARSHLLLLGRKTAAERVASFLLDMAGRQPDSNEVRIPMSRTDIADYLGLTIETVSRTLSHLERAGTIALPSVRQIILRRRAALVCA